MRAYDVISQPLFCLECYLSYFMFISKQHSVGEYKLKAYSLLLSFGFINIFLSRYNTTFYFKDTLITLSNIWLLYIYFNLVYKQGTGSCDTKYSHCKIPNQGFHRCS